MNKSYALSRTQQYFAVASAIVLSLLVVWGAVFGATTISTNVSTGGNLTVSGVSTLTGAVTVAGLTTLNGNASTTALSTSGDLMVNGRATTTADGNSSVGGTLSVAGASTLTGNVTAGGNVNASGNVTASSTSSTLKGVGVATTTPATEFAATGSATTTLYLDTTKANTGSCIELRAASSTAVYRMYIGSNDPATTTANTTLRNESAIVALWERGSCK